MSNGFEGFNGVSNAAVRELVKTTYKLGDIHVDVEHMSTYTNCAGNTEYEFKATFENKSEWFDEGYVVKFLTVSIRDEY